MSEPKDDSVEGIAAMRAHDREHEVGYSIRSYHHAVDFLLKEVAAYKLMQSGLENANAKLHAQLDEARAVADALYAAHEQGRLIPPDALREVWPMAAEVRAEARAEVERLRAENIRLRSVLAEPSEEEAQRLGDIAHSAYYRAPGWVWRVVARAILADLRARAGGSDG